MAKESALFGTKLVIKADVAEISLRESRMDAGPN